MIAKNPAPPLAPPMMNFLSPSEEEGAATAGVDDADDVGVEVAVEELELLEAEEVDVGFDDE